MRNLWLLGLSLLLVCACDSGSTDDSSDPADEVTVQEPEDTGPGLQCTQHKTCSWGELCLEHQCQVPAEAPGASAFDFTATDENSGSATYGSEITLSDYHGSVILLYFSSTTCDACIADAKVYEGAVKQLEYKGFAGAAVMISVILPNNGSAMANFTAGLQFPVVLDSSATGIAQAYSGNKDTVVLIDGAGYVRESWASLEVRGGAADKSLLNTRLAELANELL